jgi:DNA-binding CsgD family transcriptional regulator
VLRLLVTGRGRVRIAENLGISENTVNSHVQQLYRKLDVHSRQELLDLFA